MQNVRYHAKAHDEARYKIHVLINVIKDSF